MRSANFNTDPYVREFGVMVRDEMTEVNGRVLQAPSILYGGRVRHLAPDSISVRQAGHITGTGVKSPIFTHQGCSNNTSLPRYCDTTLEWTLTIIRLLSLFCRTKQSPHQSKECGTWGTNSSTRALRSKCGPSLALHLRGSALNSCSSKFCGTLHVLLVDVPLFSKTRSAPRIITHVSGRIELPLSLIHEHIVSGGASTPFKIQTMSVSTRALAVCTLAHWLLELQVVGAWAWASDEVRVEQVSALSQSFHRPAEEDLQRCRDAHPGSALLLQVCPGGRQCGAHVQAPEVHLPGPPAGGCHPTREDSCLW